MTTDRRSGGSAGRTGTALSRRAFLAASGATIGTGLVGASTAGDGAPSQELSVAATGPYRPAVRRTLGDAVESVEPASAFGEGAAVLVSGRPIEAAGRLEGVVADATGTLDPGRRTWRECLSRTAVGRRWSSDTPIEAWSEATRSIDALDGSDRAERAMSDRSVLVRGTRAFQYAQGHGGVGYYDVDADALEGGARVSSDDATPLVRLAHVHVEDDVALEGGQAALVDRYRERADALADVADLFVDPAVDR